jgi:glyoxylase-like metal-dependent hydrolase (beta-lactamase superfamily II)
MAGTRRDGVRIQRVIDLDPFSLPLNFLFPDATMAALAPAREALAGTHIDWPHEAVLLAVQSHLVRFAGTTILIDTCIGEHKHRPARPEWHQRASTRYIANLAAAGCTAEDVDIVLCTHLPADHVGWNTRLDSGRWVPTFPNARYVMSEVEVEHFSRAAAANAQVNHGSFHDSVLPIVERGLVTLALPGDAIVDGGKILSLPGHTPGQIGLELDDGPNGPIVFCGDAIHSPVQVFLPEVSTGLCYDKAQAAETRWKLIKRAAGENLRLIPAHLRGGCMRIRAAKRGFVPAFEL